MVVDRQQDRREYARGRGSIASLAREHPDKDGRRETPPLTPKLKCNKPSCGTSVKGCSSRKMSGESSELPVSVEQSGSKGRLYPFGSGDKHGRLSVNRGVSGSSVDKLGSASQELRGKHLHHRTAGHKKTKVRKGGP